MKFDQQKYQRMYDAGLCKTEDTIRGAVEECGGQCGRIVESKATYTTPERTLTVTARNLEVFNQDDYELRVPVEVIFLGQKWIDNATGAEPQCEAPNMDSLDRSTVATTVANS